MTFYVQFIFSIAENCVIIFCGLSLLEVLWNSFNGTDRKKAQLNPPSRSLY